ncbi:hypothetical protein QUF80_09065 [Desulfococcaceae bacterium HSG8]|nr:hypothetical protein [Desulfococcaceae bacterium HSG8]
MFQEFINAPTAEYERIEVYCMPLMPHNYIDAAKWQKNPCARRSAEDISRFVIRHKDAALRLAAILAWHGENEKREDE